MSRLGLLILACVPFFTFSQSEDPAFKKLSVGINFELNYVDYVLRHNPPLKDIKNFRDINEKGKVGGAIGFNLEYSLTPSISLGSGLLFLDRGSATKKTHLIWVSPEDSFPTHSKIIFTSYFVEIPLKLKYNLNVANFGLYVTCGPSIGQLIYSKTSVFTYIKETHQKAVSNKIGDGYINNVLSFHIGLGINVPLTSRFTLSIAPLYRRTLTSLSHHNETRRYYHSFGLNTYLFLTFKKSKHGPN